MFEIIEDYKFKNTDSHISKDNYENLFDCDLLIIDDLGTELTTSFTMSKLSVCINERFLNHRSTIISTNFRISEISSVYGERNWSRIISSYSLLHFFGEDIRLKKKVKA